MKKLQNPSLRKRKGFTLIELIVVIAILAILAALAVPTFIGTLNNARLRTDQATARTIVSAVQVGVAEGEYVLTAAATSPSVQDLVNDGYLDKLPTPQAGAAAFAINYNNTTGVITSVTGGGNTLYPVS